MSMGGVNCRLAAAASWDPSGVCAVSPFGVVGVVDVHGLGG